MSKFSAIVLAVVLFAACSQDPASSPVSGSSGTDTPTLPDYCKNAAVIERPYHIQYRYQLVRRGTDLPTIVYIPGGPGDISLWLAYDSSAFKEFFPDGFNVMLTEPRGVGCNLLPDVIPDDTLTTQKIAADIASAIAYERLDNFIVFGWSYGTAVATLLSSELDQLGLAPTAYLLQGTIGKHFGDTFGTSASGYVREWEKLKTALPPAILTQLSTDPLPFSLSASDWANFLSQGLMIRSPGQPSLAIKLEALLGDESQRAAFKAEIEASLVETPTSPSADRLFKSIWCSEFDLSSEDAILSQGKMILLEKPNFCPNRSLRRPFDAKNYQMNAPIFYLQGDNDPATTIENARYHFDSQRSLERAFITVVGGTHFPFARLKHCREALWNSVAGDDMRLDEAIASCGEVISVTR